jgi:hypothetical protein
MPAFTAGSIRQRLSGSLLTSSHSMNSCSIPIFHPLRWIGEIADRLLALVCGERRLDMGILDVALRNGITICGTGSIDLHQNTSKPFGLDTNATSRHGLRAAPCAIRANRQQKRWLIVSDV